MCHKPTAKIIFNSEKLKLPLRSGPRQGCSVLPLLFNMVLEVLSRAIRQEKEMKSIQIGSKEVEVLLFADGVTLHIENPKNSTEKLL